jgi:hypothetical protein
VLPAHRQPDKRAISRDGGIKNQTASVIPRIFSGLTFVKVCNETFVAAGDTFLTGIAFI